MAVFALLAIILGLHVVSPSAESGNAPATKPGARAVLKMVRFQPLTLSGHAFKPGERVRVSADGLRKTVVAGARGGFKVSFRGVSSCGGVVVTAVGSEGSRASLSFAFNNVHCLEPLEAVAAKPTVRVVTYRPLTVRGDAFKSGERVRLIVLGSVRRVTRTINATARGSFRASFTRLGTERCSMLVVAAVGSMGSRASASVLHRPCGPPRFPPPRQ
jgi:hypothetical protein